MGLKHAAWIVAASLLCLCLLLGWHLVDRAAAANAAYAQVDRAGMRSAGMLVTLQMDWIGRPEADLVALAQRMKGIGALVEREGDVVRIDELVFRMKQRRVVSVDTAP